MLARIESQNTHHPRALTAHIPSSQSTSNRTTQEEGRLPYAPGPFRWPLFGNMVSALLKYKGIDKFDWAMMGALRVYVCFFLFF